MRRLRTKGFKKYYYYNFILSLIFICSLGSLGIGYAAWNDSVYMNGTLATGYIKPVFTEAKLLLNSGKSCGGVVVSEKGTKLCVNIPDARPGDIYFLRFQVGNKGTVPVKANQVTVTSGEALDIQITRELAGLIDRQSTTQGEIRIRVCPVQVDCVSSFTVQLPFGQVTAL